MSETTHASSIPQTTLPLHRVSEARGECKHTESYETLYTDCYTQAYSRAYYLLRSHEDAEDAVQSAFCEVWKHWPHLEARGLHAYLHQCITWMCINILRSKYRRTISIEAQQIDAAVSWDVDTMLDVTSARAGLSPDQQIVVTLREEGYSWKEIKLLLGLTVGQINKRLSCARKQLRQEVAA